MQLRLKFTLKHVVIIRTIQATLPRQNGTRQIAFPKQNTLQTEYPRNTTRAGKKLNAV